MFIHARSPSRVRHWLVPYFLFLVLPLFGNSNTVHKAKFLQNDISFNAKRQFVVSIIKVN